MLSDKLKGETGSKEKKQPRLQQQSDAVSYSLVDKIIISSEELIVLLYKNCVRVKFLS